jgi:hypothetical protein
MDQVEYRIERIRTNGSGSPRAQLVERLDELGRDGWRVRSVDLTGHPSFVTRPVTGLLERTADMHRVEYRIEEVDFDGPGSMEAQLLARLDELGREGWHATSVDLAEHPSFGPRAVPILLEHDEPGAARAG